MNVERGESYFFNVRTGETSEEHPNMKQVRATEKKQRQVGEQQMQERLCRLQGYEEQLCEGQRTHSTQYSEHAEKVLSDASALALPASAARWVRR